MSTYTSVIKIHYPKRESCRNVPARPLTALGVFDANSRRNQITQTEAWKIGQGKTHKVKNFRIKEGDFTEVVLREIAVAGQIRLAALVVRSMIDSLDKVKELTSLVSQGIVATNNGDPDLERFQRLAEDALDDNGQVDMKQLYWAVNHDDQEKNQTISLAKETLAHL